MHSSDVSEVSSNVSFVNGCAGNKLVVLVLINEIIG